MQDFLITSIIASVVLTIVINILPMLFPKSSEKMERKFAIKSVNLSQDRKRAVNLVFECFFHGKQC